jgi:hypothetical protein
MSEKEIKESKEASHFMSFCAIIASQNSLPAKKQSIYSNMVSEPGYHPKTFTREKTMKYHMYNQGIESR